MASNRYIYNTILKKRDEKRYLSTTIYPKIKPNNNDIYIIVDNTDRLDLLANKYYNNSEFFWIIAVANNINNGDMYLKEGTQIRIPSDIVTILRDFEKINK
ncbi:MAG: hypothetical protein FJ375_03685 [Pelagibacterales bacterium]|nr:hypothetical protein [Pelagibacterales bacterium]